MARFEAVGGDIIDRAQNNRTVTLAEAYGKLGAWCREALIEARAESPKARIFATDAKDLAAAITVAIDWRRAAGWARPEDADRVSA